MAKNIHVAHIGRKQIDSLGGVVDKEEASIKQMLHTTGEDRVLEDDTIPSTAGNPTVKDYLIAEAAADYVLKYIDQNMIVTYEE